MAHTRKTHVRSKTEADQTLFKRHRVTCSDGSMKIIALDAELPKVKSALNRGVSFNVEPEEEKQTNSCFAFLRRR